MKVKITQDTTSVKGNLAWYLPCIGQTLEVYEKDADTYGSVYQIEPYKDFKEIPKADAVIVE